MSGICPAGRSVPDASEERNPHRHPSVTAALKGWIKRRRAIEPHIGHMKSEGLLGHCHLKGAEGDAMHAVRRRPQPAPAAQSPVGFITPALRLDHPRLAVLYRIDCRGISTKINPARENLILQGRLVNFLITAFVRRQRCDIFNIRAGASPLNAWLHIFSIRRQLDQTLSGVSL